MAVTIRRLGDTLAQRHDLIRVVVSGLLLGIGVNLISAELPGLIKAYLPPIMAPLVPRLGLWLGLLFTLLALGLLSTYLLGSTTLGGKFDGVIPFDSKHAKIVPIPEYDLAEDLDRCITAVTVENAALAALWREHPLHTRSDEGDAKEKSAPPEASTTDRPSSGPRYVAIFKVDADDNKPEPRSYALLREALEFVVLEALSTHLSTYFNDVPDDHKPIREYNRDDVPRLLLDNRVLSLLSTPLEDRAPFIEYSKNTKSSPGEMHLMLGDDGTMYSRFDLRLPRGSTVDRPRPGVLIVKSPRLRLEIAIEYGGYGASVSNRFVAGYLQMPPKDLEFTVVSIEVRASIPRWSLLHVFGWNYYKWVDSFCDKIKNDLDFEEFERRIGWASLSAYMEVYGYPRRWKRPKKNPPLPPAPLP